MSEAVDFASERSGRLQALIGDYLDAVQSGRPVDRDAWLADHPEMAEELRAFLADYHQFQELVAPLRDVAGADPTMSYCGADSSIGSGSTPDGAPQGGNPEAPPAAGARIRYFGDYELLRTLGEGGMGIVFEARQRALDRIVALKMIRTGRFAGAEDLRRFRNEAEAVARLDHPHIVPVYEVGEHEGHHYFSMKRIEGTSLAADLSGYRDRPREAARLVATMARALHHAHQRGVLHRDLKPSNILLDARGEPHLTDFGLAKRLEGDGGAEATRSGAILGTPGYMAPEQAGGRRGEVTTATDVYGLGALLYALLTGRAPFRGDSVADTLVQVREGSPEPIRRSNASVPRDLETICLRCLEREPRRRYASADAVAEELECWLRGEPIAARPAGKLERGWMWCRRNPMVAGLTASVLAVLVVSTAVSATFAVRENDRARAAARARLRAEDAEDDARNAHDQIEGEFARSLIEPLDAAGDARDVLGPLEVEALWELAGDASGSLGLRFLDEAARGPIAARQLCARAEPALIAAVGLDQDKRQRALARLMERLGETGVPPAHKADIALVALELADRPGPETRACEGALVGAIKADSPAPLLAARKTHLSRDVELLEPDTTARLIVLAMKTETDAAKLGNLVAALAKVVSRLDTANAAAVCGEALGRLTDVPFGDTNSESHWELARGVAALAARMPRGEAIRSLADTLSRLHDSEARQRLAVGLLLLMRVMAPDDLAALPPVVARTLADAYAHEGDQGIRDVLATGLAGLAKSGAKLDPSDLRPVVQSLAAALKAGKDPERRGRLACALAPMAQRLGPEESGRICLPAAESLSSHWTKENGFEPGQEWIRGLGELMIRLPIDRAARTARLLAAAANSADRNAQSYYDTQNFFHVLESLDADEAARVAPVLAAALAQERDPRVRWWLGAGLCWMAEKMDPAEAARVCGPVVGDMGEAVAMPSYIRHSVIDGFANVASRQTAAMASRSARVLADALKKEKTSSDDRAVLVEGLATVAGGMEPIEARRICGEAARGLADDLKAHEDSRFAMGLAMLADRMGPVEAEHLCGEAARIFAEALIRSGNGNSVSADTIKGLAAVSKRSNPVEAAHILEDALKRVANSQARRLLAESLAAAVGRMEPAAAARVCAGTIRALLRVRSARPRDAEDRRGFDASVAELLPRLETREAGARAAIVAALMCSEGDICWVPKDDFQWTAPGTGRMRATLSRVLANTSETETDLRAIRLNTARTGWGVGARPAARPSSCRLTSQELVDLLKMPTCFGAARRVVLDHLGNLHGRRFANHWEFVRFARENHLALDLTTPPRRPDPTAFHVGQAFQPDGLEASD